MQGEVREGGSDVQITCRPVELLHLLGVGSLQELVQIVFGGGLVLIAPATQNVPIIFNF